MWGPIVVSSIAGIVALFIAAGTTRSLKLERALLLLLAVAQISLLIAGWGGLGNVHGDFILLLYILLVGLAAFIGELFLAIAEPSRWRFFQLFCVVAFSVLLVAFGDTFGR